MVTFVILKLLLLYRKSSWFNSWRQESLVARLHSGNLGSKIYVYVMIQECVTNSYCKPRKIKDEKTLMAVKVWLE